MMRRKIEEETKQTHYRLWKSGKRWLYASATLLTIFGSGYIFDEVGVTDDIIKSAQKFIKEITTLETVEAQTDYATDGAKDIWTSTGNYQVQFIPVKTYSVIQTLPSLPAGAVVEKAILMRHSEWHHVQMAPNTGFAVTLNGATTQVPFSSNRNLTAGYYTDTGYQVYSDVTSLLQSANVTGNALVGKFSASVYPTNEDSIAYTYLILVTKRSDFPLKQVTINDFDFASPYGSAGTYNNTASISIGSGYKANTINFYTSLCSMELSDNAKVFIDGTKIMDVTHNSGGGIDECTASLGTFNNTVTTGTLAIQNNTTGHFGFTLQNIVGTSSAVYGFIVSETEVEKIGLVQEYVDSDGINLGTLYPAYAQTKVEGTRGDSYLSFLNPLSAPVGYSGPTSSTNDPDDGFGVNDGKFNEFSDSTVTYTYTNLPQQTDVQIVGGPAINQGTQEDVLVGRTDKPSEAPSASYTYIAPTGYHIDSITSTANGDTLTLPTISGATTKTATLAVAKYGPDTATDSVITIRLRSDTANSSVTFQDVSTNTVLDAMDIATSTGAVIDFSTANTKLATLQAANYVVKDNGIPSADTTYTPGGDYDYTVKLLHDTEMRTDIYNVNYTVHHDYTDNTKDHDAVETLQVTRTYYWDKVTNAEVPATATMANYAVAGNINVHPSAPVYAFKTGDEAKGTLSATGDLQLKTVNKDTTPGGWIASKASVIPAKIELSKNATTGTNSTGTITVTDTINYTQNQVGFTDVTNNNTDLGPVLLEGTLNSPIDFTATTTKLNDLINTKHYVVRDSDVPSVTTNFAVANPNYTINLIHDTEMRTDTYNIGYTVNHVYSDGAANHQTLENVTVTRTYYWDKVTNTEVPATATMANYAVGGNKDTHPSAPVYAITSGAVDVTSLNTSTGALQLKTVNRDTATNWLTDKTSANLAAIDLSQNANTGTGQTTTITASDTINYYRNAELRTDTYNINYNVNHIYKGDTTNPNSHITSETLQVTRHYYWDLVSNTEIPANATMNEYGVSGVIATKPGAPVYILDAADIGDVLTFSATTGDLQLKSVAQDGKANWLADKASVTPALIALSQNAATGTKGTATINVSGTINYYSDTELRIDTYNIDYIVKHDYTDNTLDHETEEEVQVTRTYYWDKVTNSAVSSTADMSHYGVSGVIATKPVAPVYALHAGDVGDVESLDTATGALQFKPIAKDAAIGWEASTASDVASLIQLSQDPTTDTGGSGDIEIIDTIYYYKDVVRFNDITTNAVLNIYGLTGYVGGPIDFTGANALLTGFEAGHYVVRDNDIPPTPTNFQDHNPDYTVNLMHDTVMRTDTYTIDYAVNHVYSDGSYDSKSQGNMTVTRTYYWDLVTDKEVPATADMTLYAVNKDNTKHPAAPVYQLATADAGKAQLDTATGDLQLQTIAADNHTGYFASQAQVKPDMIELSKNTVTGTQGTADIKVSDTINYYRNSEMRTDTYNISYTVYHDYSDGSHNHDTAEVWQVTREYYWDLVTNAEISSTADMSQYGVSGDSKTQPKLPYFSLSEVSRLRTLGATLPTTLQPNPGLTNVNRLGGIGLYDLDLGDMGSFDSATGDFQLKTVRQDGKPDWIASKDFVKPAKLELSQDPTTGTPQIADINIEDTIDYYRDSEIRTDTYNINYTVHHDYADNAKDHDEQEHMTVTRTYYWDKVANAEVPLNATMNHYAVHGVIVDDPTDPVYAFAAGYTGAATLDKADGDLQLPTVDADIRVGYTASQASVTPNVLALRQDANTGTAKTATIDVTDTITYTADPYAITYLNQDGTVFTTWDAAYTTVPTSYTAEDAVILPKRDNVDKPGKIFLGWYDNNAFTGDAITDIPIGTIGDKVYYAKMKDDLSRIDAKDIVRTIGKHQTYAWHHTDHDVKLYDEDAKEVVDAAIWTIIDGQVYTKTDMAALPEGVYNATFSNIDPRTDTAAFAGLLPTTSAPRAVTSQAKITILAKDEGTLLNAGERRNLLTVLSGFILMMLSAAIIKLNRRKRNDN